MSVPPRVAGRGKRRRQLSAGVSAGPASRVRPALIHKGPRLWPRHVPGLDRVEPEARGTDQIIHLAVEMTTAADAPPARRQGMLPARDPGLQRQPVLDEN